LQGKAQHCSNIVKRIKLNGIKEIAAIVKEMIEVAERSVEAENIIAIAVAHE
jgi:superfamily I DNA and RNA helicase